MANRYALIPEGETQPIWHTHPLWFAFAVQRDFEVNSNLGPLILRESPIPKYVDIELGADEGDVPLVDDL